MWSLLSQTLSNSFNYQCQFFFFFRWIEVRKLFHDVRWEMENPLCLARNAHAVPCGPPPVPEPAAAQVSQRSPVLAQSSQAVRAASLLALGSLPSLGSGTTAGMQQHPSAAASDPAPPLCLTQGSEHLGEEKNPSTIATHRNKSSTQST